MKIFKASAIDDRTHMEIIASELSYNFACGLLAAKNNIDFRTVHTKTDYRTNRILIFTQKRLFIYDENRSLLLGEWGIYNPSFFYNPHILIFKNEFLFLNYKIIILKNERRNKEKNKKIQIEKWQKNFFEKFLKKGLTNVSGSVIL